MMRLRELSTTDLVRMGDAACEARDWQLVGAVSSELYGRLPPRLAMLATEIRALVDEHATDLVRGVWMHLHDGCLRTSTSSDALVSPRAV